MKKSGRIGKLVVRGKGYGLQLEGDSEWYNGFKLPEDFRAGDNVEFEYELNKDFKNIKSIKKIESPYKETGTTQGKIDIDIVVDKKENKVKERAKLVKEAIKEIKEVKEMCEKYGIPFDTQTTSTLLGILIIGIKE